MMESFLEHLKCDDNFSIDEQDTIVKITLLETIDEDSLILFLNALKNFEKENCDSKPIHLVTNKLSTDLKIVALKYTMKNFDMMNPTLILNVINLIKLNNSLSKEFFNDEYVIFSKSSEMIDIKKALKDEIKIFITELSKYFISLFKSYNKVIYTPLDNITKLPNIIEKIFIVSDIQTLSGIFSISETFSTDELMMIENAHIYIQQLSMKSAVSGHLLDGFMKTVENKETK